MISDDLPLKRGEFPLRDVHQRLFSMVKLPGFFVINSSD